MAKMVTVYRDTFLCTTEEFLSEMELQMGKAVWDMWHALDALESVSSVRAKRLTLDFEGEQLICTTYADNIFCEDVDISSLDLFNSSAVTAFCSLFQKLYNYSVNLLDS